ADRLGIVYTPIEIVDFILHSVEAVLEDAFGQRLTDAHVHILDPFTGTGTFLVRLLQSGLIRPEDLVRKYRQELHANEIVLLAYYLAAINIEQTFHAMSGQDYEPFPGVLLTDTFQQWNVQADVEDRDMDLTPNILSENNQRRARQNRTKIRVIIGNPPYSGVQKSANDNNKNLEYPRLDEEIRALYAQASAKTNKNSLYDSYIRAFRWATNRIGNQGVIGFVTNAGWITGNAMDGFRAALTQEFSRIYVLNLRGDQLHTNGEASRKEGGKVFDSGSRQPIAVVLLIKEQNYIGCCSIHYYAVEDFLTREQKLAALQAWGDVRSVPWTRITPNAHHDWVAQRDDAFVDLIPLGDKKSPHPQQIFTTYSAGIKTNRDTWAYNFSLDSLSTTMQRMIAFYNQQIADYRQLGDAGIRYDNRHIKWDSTLMTDARKGKSASFRSESLVRSLYRPFCQEWLYFDRQFNSGVYRIPQLFPTPEHHNVVIAVSGVGASKAFSVMMTNRIPDVQLQSNGQVYPRYIYRSVMPKNDLFTAPDTVSPYWMRDDGVRPESVQQFQRHYADATITANDVFYYVYGILHASDYRERFATTLNKELPRIPFVDTQENFWAFSQAGRELAHWHVDYEAVDPWPVEEIIEDSPCETDPLYRVEKMRWGKNPDGSADKTTIVYNAFITLRGIPLEAYDYVVNGKSALEWIMERYQVKTDKDSGILNDPNTWSNDPRYIVDLVKRVVRVSLETLRIVKNLPS
ncbi:MAG: damage-inducible protein, partial [Sulfobacillus benefaciens]